MNQYCGNIGMYLAKYTQHICLLVILHTHFDLRQDSNCCLSIVKKSIALVTESALVGWFVCMFVLAVPPVGCRMLDPQPGIELGTSALRTQSSNP